MSKKTTAEVLACDIQVIFVHSALFTANRQGLLWSPVSLSYSRVMCIPRSEVGLNLAFAFASVYLKTAPVADYVQIPYSNRKVIRMQYRTLGPNC